jgi:hypothetical protein
VLSVDPREREQTRAARGVADLLGAVAKRGVLLGDPGQLADRLVERRVGDEVVLRVGPVGAEQVVVQVVGNRLANMVCRAFWSPPGPVKPCSSP